MLCYSIIYLYLEMIDLRKQNHLLYSRIDELKLAQHSLQLQVEKLQQELSQEYERYRY